MLKVISTEKIQYEYEGTDPIDRVNAKILALSMAIFDAHCERAELLNEEE